LLVVTSELLDTAILVCLVGSCQKIWAIHFIIGVDHWRLVSCKHATVTE